MFLIFKQLKKILVALFVVSLLMPAVASAASLYFETSQEQYQLGETFVAAIMTESEDECINTFALEIDFDKDILEAVDFTRGGSLITVWLQLPEIDQAKGRVSFSGGIPGGYCGRVPGDPGNSNLLGKIIFKTKRAGQTNIKFSESSRVLLHDGLGTEANLNSQEFVLEVLAEQSEAPLDEWQAEIAEDVSPPEPFKVKIEQERQAFEGEYFILFSANDKQTGIDYYEVKEGEGDWQRAESPCLLEDQGLRSIIMVKAVDKAGNERVVELEPFLKEFPVWTVLAIVLAIALFIWLLLKRRY